MKHLISLTVVALALGTFASSSFAAVPEDCYTESGLKVVDGQFLVFVNTTGMSAANVLNLEQKAEYAPGLLPTGYPTIESSNSMMISLELGTDQISPVVPRASLKAEANKSIKELMQLPGVQVECNHIMIAHPL